MARRVDSGGDRDPFSGASASPSPLPSPYSPSSSPTSSSSSSASFSSSSSSPSLSSSSSSSLPSPSPSPSPSFSSSSSPPSPSSCSAWGSLWRPSCGWSDRRDLRRLGGIGRCSSSGRSRKASRSLAMVTAMVVLALVCSPIPEVSASSPAVELIKGIGNLAKGSQALLRRLARERERRKDSRGEEQIQRLLDSLKSSFVWWKGAFGMGYDFASNYFWKKSPTVRRLELGPALLKVDGLMVALDDFRQRASSSEWQRDGWIRDNWEKIARMARDLINDLLKIFDKTVSPRYTKFSE
ncbi:hypothetical protein CBR_g5618 [Chara braunii]|uniref:Uncharacterized protein n=1 Tax=Chara braunii TaxID=69332 RepID=A0A388JRP2_CHABU|nr:hypothetical protein CBR_g5618 [Chara braunii]|eukprot:GBG60443.1 hypothetical protein CBR_g5618 [Chara braunii]